MLDILDSLLFECVLPLLEVVHSLVDTEGTEDSPVVSVGWHSCAGGLLMDYPLKQILGKPRVFSKVIPWNGLFAFNIVLKPRQNRIKIRSKSGAYPKLSLIHI